MTGLHHQNLIRIIGLALTLSIGSLGAWSEVWAECPNEVPLRVNLSADEFMIPGYDAAKGVLSIRPQQDLPPNRKRNTGIRLIMGKKEIHMRVSPEALKLGLDQGRQALELVVEGTPSARAAAVQTGDCDELVPKKIILKRDGLPIGDVEVPNSNVRHKLLDIRVRVSVDEGGARGDQLKRLSRSLARVCGEKAGGQSGSLRGALSLELRKSLLDEVEPIKVVVDGLVNQRFTYCLVAAIQEDTPLWAHLDPGTRLYLNLYLTGSPASP